MTKIWASALASVFLGNAAFAGAPETIITPEPAIADWTPAVTDWSGFYAGASASNEAGDGIYSLPATNVDITSTKFGGFLGYNIQRGSLVFGGEVAYSSGEADIVSTILDEYIFDLKGRIGYIFGNAMVYGVAGAVSGRQSNVSNAVDFTGFSYGVGADLLLGEHMFVGAELLARDYGGDFNNTTGAADYTTTSSQLRVGWKF